MSVRDRDEAIRTMPTAARAAVGIVGLHAFLFLLATVMGGHSTAMDVAAVWIPVGVVLALGYVLYGQRIRSRMAWPRRNGVIFAVAAACLCIEPFLVVLSASLIPSADGGLQWSMRMGALALLIGNSLLAMRWARERRVYRERYRQRLLASEFMTQAPTYTERPHTASG